MSYFYWRNVIARPGIVNPVEIKYLNKYEGDFSLYLYLWQSFLDQCLDLKDSKPSSWHSLSVEVPLIAPVVVKHELYWADWSWSWKAEL